MQVVIYKNDSGGVSIINPVQECVDKYGIEAIAAKDVPEGKPYKIVDKADIPSDRTFRDAWEIEEAGLTDGVGSDLTSFEEDLIEEVEVVNDNN